MSVTNDPPPADDAPIETRQWAHAIAFVAVVVVLLAGLAIWILGSVFATCACTSVPA